MCGLSVILRVEVPSLVFVSVFSVKGIDLIVVKYFATCKGFQVKGFSPPRHVGDCLILRRSDSSL